MYAIIITYITVLVIIYEQRLCIITNLNCDYYMIPWVEMKTKAVYTLVNATFMAIMCMKKNLL